MFNINGVSFKEIFNILVDSINSNIKLKALIALLLFMILAKTISYLVKTYFEGFVKKTANTLDDELLDKTEAPFVLMIVLIGIIVSLRMVEWNHKLILVLESIVIILAAQILSAILRILLKFWEEEWSIRSNVHIDNIMFSFIDKALFITIISVAGLIVLNKWNVSIGPIIASLGIAGVILGFGLKDSFANIFSGLFLIMDKVYNYNDPIRLNTGEFGKVIDVGFRSTRIRTFDNEILIIPNNKISNAIIKNYARPNSRIRTEIPVSVAYGTKVEDVNKVVLNAIKKVPGVLDDPEPFLYFKKMGEYSLDFSLYYWSPNFLERFKSKDLVNKEIYDALNNAGINIPFPTRINYLYNEGKSKRINKENINITKNKSKVKKTKNNKTLNKQNKKRK